MSERLYHVLIGDEVCRFADPSRAGGAYPMYFKDDNGNYHLENVKDGWLLVPFNGSDTIELMDIRSEIRPVNSFKDALVIASTHKNWAAYAEAEKLERYRLMEVTNALVYSELSTFLPFFKEALQILKEVTNINKQGGANSRKIVSEQVDKLIVDGEHHLAGLLKLQEAL